MACKSSKWVGEFRHSILQGGKSLRCGYTTGSCAALGAKAATEYLLTGRPPTSVEIRTPKGIPVRLSQLEYHPEKDSVTCGIRKDGGDDIDATHGAMVYTTVTKTADVGIQIEGGIGVGRVTRKGLDQPVGAAAINSVPRKMIAQEVTTVCQKYGYTGGVQVIVSVPNGEEIAERTFNSQVGILGGISILGTSGIVEPFSMSALIDTIEIEVKIVAAEGGTRIIGVPGNYGEDFLESSLQLNHIPMVKYSNFLGEFLDFATENGIREVLLVGHSGKMVKVAGGIMNTHSRYADSRREIIAAYTALSGGSQQLIKELLHAVTTEECIALLKKEKLADPVWGHLLERMDFHLARRVGKQMSVGAVVFSSNYGLVGTSPQGKNITKQWRKLKK